MKNLSTLISIIIFLLAFIFYSMFSWGFVCFKFWEWFIVPVFPTLPHIGLIQCIGLMFFISLFKNHYYKEKNDEKNDDNTLENLKLAIIYPWLTVLLGYIFKLFIL